MRVEVLCDRKTGRTLDVRYIRCNDICRVSVRFVMFSRFVGVSSNKVCVVVVLTENVVEVIGFFC